MGVEGLKELSDKLSQLNTKLAGKTLRQSAMIATTPVVKEWKAGMTVGTRAHRTYKGRLVAPGFAKRNVKRRSKYKNGRATILIGVAAEAFYAVSFVDKDHLENTFIRNRKAIEDRFARELKRKILAVARK